MPEEKVGAIRAIEPVSGGMSGARVYAVSAERGELILRIGADPAVWAQQLVVLRRAAAAGVAPAIVHVDEEARAVVSERVAGMPLPAVLGDPAQRDRAIGSMVEQLRVVHDLDRDGVAERDPVAHARAAYGAARARPGFPAWAAAFDPILDEGADALAADPRRVVGHNDVNPGNVLWDGTRAWLVDWDVAGLAHPFYDLAAFATFLRLPPEAAHALLALQERRTPDAAEQATFATLRRLIALLLGGVCLQMLPDLSLLPDPPMTLTDFYAAMREGRLRLQDPAGQAAFGLAFLKGLVV